MKVQLLGKILQDVASADAVALFIEGRSIDADAHALFHHSQDAAADAALGGDPHPDGELAGAVVHAAGQHNGLGHLDSVFVNEPFSCLRMPASVGQHQPQAGQALCRDA